MALEWFLVEDAAPLDQDLIFLIDGRQRYGRWNEQRQEWVSTIDPRLILRPRYYRPMPEPAGRDG